MFEKENPRYKCETDSCGLKNWIAFIPSEPFTVPVCGECGQENRIINAES